VVLNAANEVAVARFLGGGIGFSDIVRNVEAALEADTSPPPKSIADVIGIDRETRLRVEARMKASCD
jgi:1-deoxy-D-xylulose-5-phosphate reductoisomerase